MRNTSCSSSADRARRPSVEALQLELDVGEHARIEQLAELLGAEQVAQQVAVERQRRRPPLGERRVALVHVGRDPVEQQARRHRAGPGGVDLDDPDRPRAELAEHLAEGGHVEHVLEALTRGLEQDRERRVLGGDRQQVGRPLALLPERRAPIGPPARQQQGSPGAFAEAGREQRRLGQGRHDELVDVVGVDQQGVERQLVGGLRQSDDDAVVAPHRLDRQVERVHQPALDRHRPRGVHRRAERAEDAHPPVADLVAEALDDDRAVVGHGTRGLALLVEVLDEVRRRERVERVVLAEARFGRLGREIADLAHERPERPAELERAARTVAVPERHLAGLARRRRDRDALERDVFDAPRRRAEHERLAGAALVDHLLVELADAGAVGEEHTEQPAVGDRAAARDRQPLGSVAGPDGVVDAVPHEPRPQLGELLARVAAGEQVEHVAEQVVGELGEVGAAPHESGQIGHRDVAGDRDVGDDLLGEHVERVAQVVGVLDQAVDHAARRRSPPRAGRRGAWGRSCRGSAHRPGARRGRCVAARGSPRRATRPG